MHFLKIKNISLETLLWIKSYEAELLRDGDELIVERWLELAVLLGFESLLQSFSIYVLHLRRMYMSIFMHF